MVLNCIWTYWNYQSALTWFSPLSICYICSWVHLQVLYLSRALKYLRFTWVDAFYASFNFSVRSAEKVCCAFLLLLHYIWRFTLKKVSFENTVQHIMFMLCFILNTKPEVGNVSQLWRVRTKQSVVLGPCPLLYCTSQMILFISITPEYRFRWQLCFSALLPVISQPHYIYHLVLWRTWPQSWEPWTIHPN